MDVVVAALALTLAAPLLAGITLAQRFEHGSVLFRQQRIGRRGRAFTLIKFRSMRAGAAGAKLTVGRDPRITRFGHWLRRAKLDELPQLVNVLRGDMSLVGPRPEVAEYVDLQDAVQRAVLEHRPGLTDPASLVFWNEATLLADAADPDACYRAEVLPVKLRLSLAYAEDATLRSDCLLLAWTACAALGLVRRGSLPSLLSPSGSRGAGNDAAARRPRQLRQTGESLVDLHS